MLRQAGSTPAVLMRPGVGFRPDQVVEARRHAARAGRVGAQREGHLAARHGHGRARAGAAADACGIEGAGRPAIGRACAHQAGGELVQVGLAQPQRAGIQQPLHHRGTALGQPFEGLAGGGGGHAGDVDVVLDGEGHAQQGVALHQFGTGQRFLQPRRQPVQLGLPLRVAGQADPQRQLAAAQRGAAALLQPGQRVAAAGDQLTPLRDAAKRQAGVRRWRHVGARTGIPIGT